MRHFYLSFFFISESVSSRLELDWFSFITLAVLFLEFVSGLLSSMDPAKCDFSVAIVSPKLLLYRMSPKMYHGFIISTKRDDLRAVEHLVTSFYCTCISSNRLCSPPSSNKFSLTSSKGTVFEHNFSLPTNRLCHACLKTPSAYRLRSR